MFWPGCVGSNGATFSLFSRRQAISESVNLIFGKNLRILCKGAGTISDAARNLDLNRVQLARFMRGESFPKPNQLDRICTYFQVDARIFTQPLDDMHVASDAPSGSATNPLVPETLRPYAEQPMPVDDGIHLLYRPSFTFSDLFIVAPLMVRRRNRVAWLKGLDLPAIGVSRLQSGPIRERSYAGFALTTPDGFLMYFHGTGKVPFLSVAQFGSTGFFSTTGFYRGTYDMHRPAQPGEKRRVPIILEPLRQRPSVVLDALRRSGMCRIDDLPGQIRSSLLQSTSD